eukprot:273431-Pyramimonas_sp.AAC.1
MGAPPLHYRAGTVTANWKMSTYRAIVGRADIRVRWGTGTYTRRDAFARALACIDVRSRVVIVMLDCVAPAAYSGDRLALR